MVFQIGDIVQSVFVAEDMIITKVEPRRITAVVCGGRAVFEDHPRNFFLVRREKASDDEEK